MQGVHMVIKSHVDGAIGRGDADRDGVMCVVTLEAVIIEADDFPVAVREFSPRQANLSITIVISGVLKAVVAGNDVLLKSIAVDGLPKPSVNGERQRIDL